MKFKPSSQLTYPIFRLKNIFVRNYYRSTIIPDGIIKNAQRFYLNELQPTISGGNLNPSLKQITQLEFRINKYFKENLQQSEVKNFKKLLDEFAKKNSSDKNNQFTVLELIGLNQPSNQTLTQDIFFKALTISAIMQQAGIRRTVLNDDPIIGFLSNNQFLPAHCDKINDSIIPEFVAIVTINSNSKAFTFITENHLIYKNFKLQNPQSFKILQEVDICRNEINAMELSVKTRAHKIINYKGDGSIFLDYEYSRNQYSIFDPQQCKYSQEEVDKAISDFEAICLDLKESFKFVCDEKNNVVLFKNKSVLHGRSEVGNNERRKMIYLPCESFNKNKTPNTKIINPKSPTALNVSELNTKKGIRTCESFNKNKTPNTKIIKRKSLTALNSRKLKIKNLFRP
jgi:hypothetical protein